MKIDKINFTAPHMNYNNNSVSINSYASERNYQTSIYNTKGLNVYFGSLAKGDDVYEDECIKCLRAVRDGRRRKFDEDEIKEIITSLKKVESSEEKPEVLSEALTLLEEPVTAPTTKFIKQIVDINAGRPEDERFAVLEFAENELEVATKPFEAFYSIPKENQDKLVKILTKISELNENELYESEELRDKTLNSLYAVFRIPVYAHDDLIKAGNAESSEIKTESLKLLYDELKEVKQADDSIHDVPHKKVVDVTQNLFEYFLDNIL